MRRKHRMIDLPSPMIAGDRLAMTVAVYREDRRRKPWTWEVKAPSMLGWGEGVVGGWHHPAPCHVRGRTWTETEAEAMAQRCLTDVRERLEEQERHRRERKGRIVHLYAEDGS